MSFIQSGNAIVAITIKLLISFNNQQLNLLIYFQKWRIITHEVKLQQT